MKKLVLFIIMCVMISSLMGCSSRKSDIQFFYDAQYEQNRVVYPWEESGKSVEEYTWAEFEDLSAAQQEAFFDAFESIEAFEAWRISAQTAIELPWENGNKAIEEYTWAEFERLSGAQQEAFFEAFESLEAFEAWMKEAQP